MNFDREIRVEARADLSAAVRRLRQDGWLLLTISGRTADKQTFGDAVRAAVPLDPPIGLGPCNWDALADSLFGGLEGLASPRIALVWLDSDTMRDASPGDFAIALEVLGKAAEDASDPRFTSGRPKEVAVIITREPGPDTALGQGLER